MYSPDECLSTGHITILPWWLTKYFGESNGFHLEYVSGACPWPPVENTYTSQSFFRSSALSQLRNKVHNIKKRLFRWMVEKYCGRTISEDNLITNDYTNIVFVFRKTNTK